MKKIDDLIGMPRADAVAYILAALDDSGIRVSIDHETITLSIPRSLVDWEVVEDATGSPIDIRFCRDDQTPMLVKIPARVDVAYMCLLSLVIGMKMSGPAMYATFRHIARHVAAGAAGTNN